MKSSPIQRKDTKLLSNSSTVPLPNPPSLDSRQGRASSRDLTLEQDRQDSFEATSFISDYQPVEGQASDNRYRRNDWSLKVGQTIVDRWLLEIAACGGSLFMLIATFIFLRNYDGAEQPDWPYGITINSVISFFTSIMKALMFVSVASCLSQANWIHFTKSSHPFKDYLVYDSASRGFTGSLQLLLSRQVGQIASVGAVVTILAIAVDPTVQQMVTVRSDERNSSAAVSIGRAQSYLVFGDGSGGSWPPSTPAPDMYGAIYPGLFYGVQDATTAAGALDMIPSCPTGNCTFPPYQSLAVCSRCQDVSHALTHKCPNAAGYCEHSLPNGLRVNRTDEDDSHGAVATSGQLFPINNVTLPGNILLNFSRIRGTAPDLTYAVGQYVEPDLRQNVSADQCFLYWCVNTYESTVSDGHLNEQITSSWYANDTYWWSIQGVMNDERLGLVPPGIPSSSAGRLANSSIEHSTSPNPNFTVGYLAHIGISAFLAQKLTLSNSIAIEAPTTGSEGFSYGPDETSNASSYTFSQDLLRIFRDSEPDGIFANMAKSMTRNIRDQNASMQANSSDRYIVNLPGGGPASGIASQAYIYVSVRWGWLAFSAVLVLLTSVFLGLTIFSTARHDVAVWKSSPIPLLFNGLEKEEADRLRRAKGLVEMERLSSGIRFELKDDSGGGGKGVRLAEL